MISHIECIQRVMFLGDKIKALEAERDRTEKAFADRNKEIAHLMAEIDRLKAELDNWAETNHANILFESKLLEYRDAWKSRADKMAESLKRIAIGDNKERSTGMDTPPISVSRDHLRLWAKEALDAYKQEVEK